MHSALITLCICRKQKQQQNNPVAKSLLQNTVFQLLQNGILVPGCFTTYYCIINHNFISQEKNDKICQ